MKYYAVIDINVIVSSMLKAESVPGQIVKLVTKNIITPLLNEEIYTEYYDVLIRNKFGLNQKDIEDLLKSIKRNAIYLNREQTLEDFIDKDDIVFFEIVMSARNTMDAYLVTGNIKHYPVRSYVVTPAQMIKIIEEDLIKARSNNLSPR